MPEPVKRRWSRQFMDSLEFRGWGMRVAIPILAMVVFGVAVVVLTGVNSGNAGGGIACYQRRCIDCRIGIHCAGIGQHDS